MKYKALIIDFDGTTIKNGQYERPTQRVIDAIKKAQEKVIVCAATGRPISTARWIFQDLQLKNPCIISAGTKIVNPVTEEVLWEVAMPQSTVEKVLSVAERYDFQTITESQLITFPPKKERISQEECAIYIVEIPKEKSQKIIEELKHVKDTAMHIVNGYSPEQIDIHITSTQGSKQLAMH